MRFVYVDESGISSKERVTVVAGVIVNADEQLKLVEQHVENIIAEYVPEEYRKGFSFHATDLFHGGGRIFDRRHYPLERSHEILRKLLRVTGELRLPIVYGYSEKTSLLEIFKKVPPRHAAAIHHAYTYSMCAVGAERYMRQSAEPSELASLVVENNDNSQKAVKLMHALMRSRNLDDASSPLLADLEQMAPDCLPLKKIVHGVYFALKEDSSLLQIADACAFTIRCFLEAKPGIKEFCDVLTGNNPQALARDESKDFAGYNILS